jgi:hypothetical protein
LARSLSLLKCSFLCSWGCCNIWHGIILARSLSLLRCSFLCSWAFGFGLWSSSGSSSSGFLSFRGSSGNFFGLGGNSSLGHRGFLGSLFSGRLLSGCFFFGLRLFFLLLLALPLPHKQLQPFASTLF